MLDPINRCAGLMAVVLALSGWSGHARSAEVGAPVDQASVDVDAILLRAGAQVEHFFARAQRVVCTEVVSLVPLDVGFSSAELGRRVESELRLTWEPDSDGPATEAQVQRHVLRVNGRPPRQNDPNNCTTPEQQSTETQPLSMLLPQQRAKYEFSFAGLARVDGRDAIRIGFRELARASAEVTVVEGRDDCLSYTVTGGQRGRLWIDTETADVLRLDSHLVMVDLRLPSVLRRRAGGPPSLTLERFDTTTRFGRVAFEDPDESMLLPLTSMSLRILRGSGTPRLRTMTTYSGCKRFLTGGRVL